MGVDFEYCATCGNEFYPEDSDAVQFANFCSRECELDFSDDDDSHYLDDYLEYTDDFEDFSDDGTEE